jgi:O-acetyl-ADP-ribose deacetylase (regulator of RNase III)
MDAFLSFTGSTDRRVAQDYLQRGGTVESAVSLFYAEGGSGSGGVAGGTGFAMDDMDAATRAAIEHAMFSEDAVSGTTAVGKLGEVVREFRSASGNVVQIVHGDLTVEGNSASADAAVGGGAAAADAAPAPLAPSPAGLFVIVNPANKMLDHAGGLAGQLVKKGGASIDDESRAYVLAHGVMNAHGHKYILDGHVATTTAGTLPSDAIIHVVGPVWNGGAQTVANPMSVVLQAAVRNSLAQAQKMGAATIAIPAISTGKFGFPKALCAEIMLRETVAFFAAADAEAAAAAAGAATVPAGVLRTVRLTNFDRHTVDAFAALVDDAAAQTELLISRGWSSVALAAAAEGGGAAATAALGAARRVATVDAGADAGAMSEDDEADAIVDCSAASKTGGGGASASGGVVVVDTGGGRSARASAAQLAAPSAPAAWEFDNSPTPGRGAPAFQPYDAASSTKIEAAFQSGAGSWSGVVSGRFRVQIFFDAFAGAHRQQTAKGARDVRRAGGGSAAPAAALALAPSAPLAPAAVAPAPGGTAAVVGSAPSAPAVWEFDNSPTPGRGAPAFQPYDAASSTKIEAAFQSGAGSWSGVVSGRFQVQIFFDAFAGAHRQQTAKGARDVRRAGGGGSVASAVAAAPIAIAFAAPAAVATAAPAAVAWEFDNAANPGFDAPAFQPYDANATRQIEVAYQSFIVSGAPAAWQGIVGGRWQIAIAFHEMLQVTAKMLDYVPLHFTRILLTV